MNKLKLITLALATAAVMSTSTGCGFIKPYDKPEIIDIAANETAIMINLIGDAEDQGTFESEAMLKKGLVAAKQVQIPHRWVQTGRMRGSGKWIPTVKLIIVDRTPISREWNQSSSEGTAKKDQAIYAESVDSIGFITGMDITAQIDTEDDAVKFLYSYNSKSLKKVMDTDIRMKVETTWLNLCGIHDMTWIYQHKDQLVQELNDIVCPFFKDRGITITTLGMKDGFEYENKAIQKAIDQQIVSEKEKINAENMAEVSRINAEAEAKVTKILADAEAYANEKKAKTLTPELVEMAKWQAWNGKFPTTLIEGEGSTSLILDNTGK